eukprot:g3663.t1
MKDFRHGTMIATPRFPTVADDTKINIEIPSIKYVNSAGKYELKHAEENERVKLAAEALKESLQKADKGSAFWLSTDVTTLGPQIRCFGFRVVSTSFYVNVFDCLRLLAVFAILFNIFFERPLWCYDDNSYDTADGGGDGKYWSSRDQWTLDPNVVFALNIASSTFLALETCLRMHRTCTIVFVDSLAVLTSLLLAALSVLSYAFRDNADELKFCVSMNAIARLVLIFCLVRPIRCGLRMALNVLPSTGDVFMLYGQYLAIAGAIMLVLLKPDANADSDDPTKSKLEHKFGNFFKTIRSAHFYVSKQTLPSDMSVSLESEILYSIFFVIMTLFGSMFFLSLLLASVVSKAKENYAHELERQQKTLISIGLLKAFLILDHENRKSLEYSTMKTFCDELRNQGMLTVRVTFTRFRNLMNRLDRNRDGMIDISEFETLCTSLKIHKPIDKSLVKHLSADISFRHLEAVLISAAVDGDSHHLTKTTPSTYRRLRHNDALSRFSRFLQKSVSSYMTSPRLIIFLAKAFMEPAMSLDPCYRWFQLENDEPHVATQVLREMGWGTSAGRERFSGSNLWYVAPSLWVKYVHEFKQVVENVKSSKTNHEISMTTTPMALGNSAATVTTTRFADASSLLRDAKIAKDNDSSSAKPLYTPAKTTASSKMSDRVNECLRVNLLREFLETRMKAHESLRAYETRVSLLREKIERFTNAKISDDLAIASLFRGLRPSIASSVYEKEAEEERRRMDDGAPPMSYDKKAHWLRSLFVDGSFEIGPGDRVTICKPFSSHKGEAAIVHDVDNKSGQVYVTMWETGMSKTYYPNEIVLDRSARIDTFLPDDNAFLSTPESAANKSSKVGRTQFRHASKMSTASRRAAQHAVQAAIYAKIRADALRSGNILPDLSCAIAYQLFYRRRDRVRVLMYCTLGFQIFVHVGSIVVTCRMYSSANTILDLVLRDLGFYISILVIFALKILSGCHSGRSRDACAIVLLFWVEIFPAIIEPNASVYKPVNTACFVAKIFVHGCVIVRLLSRTVRFYPLERLLQGASTVIGLVLLHTFVWMIAFACIGMMAYGGLVWDQNAVTAVGGNETWCADPSSGQIMEACANQNPIYNFNTMGNSLLLLYVAAIKPFLFADLFDALTDASAYLFFFTYWLVVPIANLLLLKAIIFQRYWKEMALLKSVLEWKKRKKSIFESMPLPGRDRKYGDNDVSSSSKRFEYVRNAVVGFGSRLSDIVFTETFERVVRKNVPKARRKTTEGACRPSIFSELSAHPAPRMALMKTASGAVK